MHRVIGLLGGVVAHVDIVLLVGAGGQIVDHGGVREDTQLALKTRGGVLDHHETVVEVGVLVEERRQLAHQAVEQAVDAAVAHFAQIRDRDAEVVGRHTGIGAVGVAAHQRDRAAVLFIEDERVVDGRVELDSERRLCVLDGLFDRAVELRHAADGQRILHTVAAVTLKHGAVLQNGADVGRGVDLVGVRTHGHQALVHSHQRTLEHLKRERARNVCRQAERLRVIDRKRRERGDGRGAGEQDKAFFGREHDGLEARALERLRAVKRFALIGGLALADHHHADVALERQIADGAMTGDDGADARVEHIADQRERFKTDARMAGAEVAEHDKHHCARALLGDGLADGAGMGIDVVALDRFAVLFGDELLPVVAKARSQAIDGLAFVAEAVDMGAAVVDALFIFFGKCNLCAKARDADKVVDGGGAAKRDSVHIGSYLLRCGFRSLTGSCRSCSRRPRWRCSAPFCPSPSRRRTRRSTGGRRDGRTRPPSR